MRIGVIGTGYVGCPIAVLSATKHPTCIFDKRKQKMEQTASELQAINSCHGSLKFSNSIFECSKNSDMLFVCLPTNPSKSGNLNTSILEKCLIEARQANSECSIVIKSTIPFGFLEKYIKQTNDRKIVYCPEFLRENNALSDSLNPSRIIIGCDLNNAESKETAKKVAAYFTDLLSIKNTHLIILTGLGEAESIKLFSNAYLAMRIGFINEMDSFAESYSLNAKDMIKGVCADPRIGDFYNNPSFGFGGYCLPKDSNAIAKNFASAQGSIIKAIRISNRQRIAYVVKAICRRISQSKISKNEPIGIYRLLSKKNGKNLKSSATIALIKSLKKAIPNKIIIYEPLLKGQTFLGNEIEKDILKFKERSALIVANRISEEIEEERHKLFTRDIFNRD